MMLSQNFWTRSKPSRRSIFAAKREEKGKKGRKKIVKLKDIGHFPFQKCACLSKNVVKTQC